MKPTHMFELDRDFENDFYRTLREIETYISNDMRSLTLQARLDTPKQVDALYMLAMRTHLPFALRIPFGLQRWLEYLESQGAEAKIRAYALRLYYDAIDIDIA